jgi:hypothetical protein
MNQPLLSLSGLVELGFYGFVVRRSSRAAARIAPDDLSGVLFFRCLPGCTRIGESVDPLAHYRNRDTGGGPGHTNDRQQGASS